jgi:hypothetical protein
VVSCGMPDQGVTRRHIMAAARRFTLQPIVRDMPARGGTKRDARRVFRRDKYKHPGVIWRVARRVDLVLSNR